jgi:hypothetical protein
MVTSECKGSVAEAGVEIEESFVNRQKPVSLGSREDREDMLYKVRASRGSG